ncbi:MAG: hypothetical protein BWY28_01777 [bacterium ADurb.Bin236]|nr:MAG: hypothetical protein BWY28_01777 [bacterium ADurb.Bin236]
MKKHNIAFHNKRHIVGRPSIIFTLFGMSLLLFVLTTPSICWAAGTTPHKGVAPPLWSVIPFIGILLSIAIIPLVSHDWWHKHFPKIALIWACPVAVWALFYKTEWLFHTSIEYAAFISLIGSLFVICGGIYIKGNLRGSPLVNTAILAIGCVLANFIGTTGASMILVRPLIRANSNRKHRVHMLVFLVFLVSNIGGSLTPLADPPLYLGLLKGVPFYWTLKLLPEWLFACGILLAVFFVIDLYYYHRKEEIVRETTPVRIVIDGKRNVFFLAGILGAVLLYSQLPVAMGFCREIIQIAIMGIMAFLSYRYTPNIVHIENEFNWLPIREVTILFAGIFACMIPVLKVLEMRGGELGVVEPWQFFWATGLLSGFLDNAPTYLSFLSLGIPVSHNATDVVRLFNGTIEASILKAISIGAVYMGALTYIGNGPNFMVKSIAAHQGVKMPSFFGYMAWSFAILIPLFFLMTFIFIK